MSNNYIAYL